MVVYQPADATEWCSRLRSRSPRVAPTTRSASSASSASTSSTPLTSPTAQTMKSTASIATGSGILNFAHTFKIKCPFPIWYKNEASSDVGGGALPQRVKRPSKVPVLCNSTHVFESRSGIRW